MATSSGGAGRSGRGGGYSVNDARPARIVNMAVSQFKSNPRPHEIKMLNALDKDKP